MQDSERMELVKELSRAKIVPSAATSSLTCIKKPSPI